MAEIHSEARRHHCLELAGELAPIRPAPTDVNTILVVGRDTDTSCILELWLRHLGYVVCVVSNPDQVVEIAHAVRPSLVITNYPTRLAHGATIVEMLRVTPGLTGTRILNLTSHVFPDELAAAAAAGVDVSLRMPVRLSTVTEEVNRLIGPPAQ